jgi:hypothetical protein
MRILYSDRNSGYRTVEGLDYSYQDIQYEEAFHLDADDEDNIFEVSLSLRSLKPIFLVFCILKPLAL